MRHRSSLTWASATPTPSAARVGSLRPNDWSSSWRRRTVTSTLPFLPLPRFPELLLALETGDAGTAESFCELLSGSLLKDMPEHCPIHWIWVWKLRSELALDRGLVNLAADLAVRMSTRAAKAGIIDPAVVPWSDTAMAAFLRSGRYQDAQGLARHLEIVTAAWPRRWPRSVAESGRAGLAEVRKEHEEAEGHHRRAIDLLEDAQLPLALVRGSCQLRGVLAA